MFRAIGHVFMFAAAFIGSPLGTVCAGTYPGGVSAAFACRPLVVHSCLGLAELFRRSASGWG